MNGLDTAILILIGLSCLYGLWRGLIKEILSLLTWIAALLVARVYSESLAAAMAGIIDSTAVRYVVAFVIIFLVIMMLGSLLIFFLTKLMTLTGLRLIDRLFGGAFGIVRGVVIVLLLVFVSSVFFSETQQWQQSTLIPYALTMIDWSRVFIEDMNTINMAQ